MAVDAELVGRDGSGNETYLRGLIAGMQQSTSGTDDLVLVGPRRDALEELAGRSTTIASHRAGIFGDLTLGRTMHRLGADSVVANYTAPFGFSGPVATIVHDAAFRRLPETFPPLLRRRLEWTVRRSVRVSALILTSSEFSRSELCHFYPGLDPTRVVVTHSAPRSGFARSRTPSQLEEVRKRHRLPGNFVLAVGNLQPRKNLPRLTEAAELAGVPLVVAGRPVWRRHDPPASKSVQWLGYVPLEDLACLYQLCSVFAYPSLYEGFGLPVVEAMASGAPVVTSSTSSLPEVAGDAAVLVDPYSVDSIASAIAGIVGSPEQARRLVLRGRARAADFSWAATGRAVLNALRRVASADSR